MSHTPSPRRASVCQFFQRYFLCFVFYSIFGWCYEVFLEVVVYRWGFSNRGVLFGPYCPVYGVGALLFLLLFYRLLRGKPWKQRLVLVPVLFVVCAVSATLVELGASYLCEWLTGTWPWQTYVNYQWNFQGRIALSPSLRFGLGGVIFLYVIQPLLDRVLGAMRPKVRARLALALTLVMGFDLIVFLLRSLTT